MDDLMKTMAAKYAGTCELCHGEFPQGATIVYNGRASHAECVEKYNAEEKVREEAEYARHAEHLRAFKAGEKIKVTKGETELMVTWAPTYVMAKKAAFEFLRTMPEGSVILSKMKGGKKYTGREVVSHYGYSTMSHHEGWAFRYRVPAKEAV